MLYLLYINVETFTLLILHRSIFRFQKPLQLSISLDKVSIINVYTTYLVQYVMINVTIIGAIHKHEIV